MTTSYYKSARNYVRPQSAAPIHVPQPFLNYGGLSQMLKADYKYPVQENKNDIKYSAPQPAPYTRVPQPRALSARQRFEQNQKMQVEREKKIGSKSLYKSNKSKFGRRSSKFILDDTYKC